VQTGGFISSFSFLETELTSYFQRIVHLFEPAMARAEKRWQTRKAAAEKNKTHKKLIEKLLFGIRLSVTKVTAIETNKGIGERSREVLGESKGRAVCTCYDALS